MDVTIKNHDGDSEGIADQMKQAVIDYYNSGGIITDKDGNEIGKGIDATRRGTNVHTTIRLNEKGQKMMNHMMRGPMASIRGAVKKDGS